MDTVVNSMLRILTKDRDTYEHSLRVGKLAEILAFYCDFTDDQKRKLIIGCYLHDIGKIVIPDQILNKKSTLEVDEWEVMKQHTILGVILVENEGITDSEVIEIVRYHHERWDGSGYPYGLRGDEIPIFSRICSIVDAFDCMVSDRPYRKGMSIQQAKEELLSQNGKQFDPFYVEIFLRLPDLLLGNLEQLYYIGR